jgi:hypothetical protein
VGTLRIVDTEGRGDAATFAAHLAEGPDDRAEHLLRCGPCARVARELRTEPVGPDLELRLLQAFREWRGV